MIFLIDTVIGQVIILIRFGIAHGIWLTGKTHQPFFKNVNSQRLIGSNDNINSQIEFMTVDQERVLDVLGDDGDIFEIYFGNVVDNVDSSTPRRICWLNDPQVLFGASWSRRNFSGFFLILLNEFSKLIWQTISFRQEIESLSTVFVAQLRDIDAESIFPSDFITLWKMINFLIFV